MTQIIHSGSSHTAMCGLPLLCAPHWGLWAVSVFVGLPFCPLQLLMLLLEDGWRPAKPVHCFPFSALCSHGHLSCCSVFYFSASSDYAFAPFGLAVTGCISSIKCSRALHSSLPLRVTLRGQKDMNQRWQHSLRQKLTGTEQRDHAIL